MLGPAPLESQLAKWVAVGVALLLAAGGTFAVLGALGDADPGGEPPVSGGGPGAVLTRDVHVLAGPRATANLVLVMSAGSEVHVFGRSFDGEWLAVVPAGLVDAVGWVPADTVRGTPDPALLAYIDSLPEGRAPLPVGASGPELVLVAVGTRGNRLALILANAGGAEVPGPLSVSVDEAAPTRVELVRPLAAAEIAEVVVENEYVQRRATATVLVAPPPGVRETNEADNRVEATVEPDQPNDLGIESAETDPRDGHLIVTLRNHSPIPLVGMVVLGVRQAESPGRSLAQVEAAIDVDAGGTQPIDVRQVTRVDPRSLRVTLSTDAITDANPANDTLPPR